MANMLSCRCVVRMAAILCSLISAEHCRAASPPNILFVLFDDLGYGQPESYQPATTFKLPNFERLVKEGMRFTDAHSAAAVCTPTRYGVLTGRYPSRIGQFGVCTTYSRPIIPTSRLTVASLLKQHGYTTACIGKWHLGLNWVEGRPGKENEVPLGSQFADGPTALGFDYFYGFTHARNIGTILEQDRVVEHVAAIDNQPRMIARVVAWMQTASRGEKPFFLYFPMCPPHTPIVPSAAYAGKSGAEDLVGKDPNYGDWILQGDAMLGQLLDVLDREQIAENTLVIATSDNGAEHRAYAPLRDSKRSIYEGGHRVPFVARWTGKVAAGAEYHAPICLNDFMATAADLVNATLPDNAAEDSYSLLPILLDPTEKPLRPATVHQSVSGDLALREKEWKLIFFKNGRRELYNLTDDLGERHDVAEAHPDRVKALSAAMQQLIDNGRSNAGPAVANEHPLSLSPAATRERSGVRKRNNKNNE